MTGQWWTNLLQIIIRSRWNIWITWVICHVVVPTPWITSKMADSRVFICAVNTFILSKISYMLQISLFWWSLMLELPIFDCKMKGWMAPFQSLILVSNVGVTNYRATKGLYLIILTTNLCTYNVRLDLLILLKYIFTNYILWFILAHR